MPAVVELQDICKSYKCGDAREFVLKNINLSVEAGQVTSLIGPSGSGKSTLLHITGLLDTQSSGSVVFDGVDVVNFSDNALAKLRCKDIGFIYQHHHLLVDFSVMNNVILPHLILGKTMKVAKQRASELLNELNVGHIVHKKVSDLSGGEKQRVSIARSLINKPKLILADEPTGSLDDKNSMIVFSLLLSVVRSMSAALLIVTHNNDIAKQADRVVTMSDLRK